MNILISCIGKLEKTSPEAEIIKRYISRTPWKIEIKEFEVKNNNLPEQKRKEQESSLLMSCFNQRAKNIVLDENGKSLSTNDFSRLIQQWQNQAINNLVFYIGGASGHGAEILSKADYRLCFGNMTWPHMLVRAMLTEQIYRTYTVLNGHPYSK